MISFNPRLTPSPIYDVQISKRGHLSSCKLTEFKQFVPIIPPFIIRTLSHLVELKVVFSSRNNFLSRKSLAFAKYLFSVRTSDCLVLM